MADTALPTNLSDLTEEEFLKAIADHKEFIDSGQKRGKRLDLSHKRMGRSYRDFTSKGGDFSQVIAFEGANFDGRNFAGAAFGTAVKSGAYLKSASFRSADLTDANFQNANLTGAQFGTADVTGAIFQDADLTGADVSRVIGLIPEQLTGTVLTRAKLPADIAAFPALVNIAELSKNAGIQFTALLAACLFALLTAYTTRDLQLVLESGTATLPVVNLAVPVRLFFVVAPVVLGIQFVTVHLYLNKLWQQMATLPAVFPDGTTVDKKTYPWLLNDLIRPYFPKLWERTLPLDWIQERTFSLLVYWLTPLIGFFLWWRCLCMHRWEVTGPQAASVVMLACSAILARYYMALILRRDRRRIAWAKDLRHWPMHKRMHVYWLLTFCFTMGVLSDGAINGISPIARQRHDRVREEYSEQVKIDKSLKWMDSTGVEERVAFLLERTGLGDEIHRVLLESAKRVFAAQRH